VFGTTQVCEATDNSANLRSQDVGLDPALSAAAEAFCASDENISEVQYFRSGTQARTRGGGGADTDECMLEVESFQSGTEARTCGGGGADTDEHMLEVESFESGTQARTRGGGGADTDEHMLEVESFESGTQARTRGGGGADTRAHAPAGIGPETGVHACDKVRAGGIPLLEMLEGQKHTDAEVQALSRTDTSNTFTHCMAAVSGLPCVSDALLPASVADKRGSRRRRRTELETLQPSAGATHKLLSGALVTDPRIVGPMPSGCQ
jgi:alpha-D-ribose 1-methylphosphonate 5-triphosphate synthase subunit PhnH